MLGQRHRRWVNNKPISLYVSCLLGRPISTSKSAYCILFVLLHNYKLFLLCLAPWTVEEIDHIMFFSSHSKHKTLNQFWFNIGPPSTTLVQPPPSRVWCMPFEYHMKYILKFINLLIMNICSILNFWSHIRTSAKVIILSNSIYFNNPLNSNI